MDLNLVVHGQYVGQTFIPSEPMPLAEGPAQLVITLTSTATRGSIAAAFGSATKRRSGTEILDELHATREKLLAKAGGTIEGLMAKLREDQAKSGRTIIKNVNELPNSKSGTAMPPELHVAPANEK